MKKCLRCTKQATLHITELKGGKSLSLHLCETCAQEYLSTVEVGGIPDEFSGAPKGNLETSDIEDSGESGPRACPHCGITFKEFRSQGRLGCPRDYEVFHSELVPLLESIHGETQHVGKFPPRVSETSRRQFELVRLRSELKTAVDDEQYELAARLRDQIQQIEAETRSS
ncbi:UvrB/UvrC motif-containing protein [Planctomicrobium piriforme]|uniref:Protein arginine kinase activator n=1 Tax=Planctomicrobium piriforme TaxID=1576369 RepID=A0A1I3T9V3_9PLAN|nr:UvrB/UvrC motif-containing protein [Planctomicrobium piriforme]SFJ67282.1 protein arginine kinase activator [Planctomicrobium piriforme]